MPSGNPVLTRQPVRRWRFRPSAAHRTRRPDLLGAAWRDSGLGMAGPGVAGASTFHRGVKITSSTPPSLPTRRSLVRARYVEHLDRGTPAAELRHRGTLGGRQPAS